MPSQLRESNRSMSVSHNRFVHRQSPLWQYIKNDRRLSDFTLNLLSRRLRMLRHTLSKRILLWWFTYFKIRDLTSMNHDLQGCSVLIGLPKGYGVTRWHVLRQLKVANLFPLSAPAEWLLPLFFTYFLLWDICKRHVVIESNKDLSWSWDSTLLK